MGSLLEISRRGQYQVDQDWARQYGKVYGSYAIFNPVLTVCNAELVKQILIKDFPVFVNRGKQRVYHEIWAQSLFMTEDDQWKR